MTKKKSTATKKTKTWKQIIKEAKERLPSERTKIRCTGCFNPRNTLTVKGNLEHSWTDEQIEIATDKQGVYLPCKECKVIRFLSMSKFSLDVFKSDLGTYKLFTLLKDDKYNALIGVDVSEMAVDLKEWSK
ncbi:hypothetical protein LCGC14_2186230 [marine sediment metagenome]|uniref:Uncharacterized protein n=1 Tax=marine sediment metagenome TaxID=412755 RepID=A0A0F9DL50_9ZZZZ